MAETNQTKYTEAFGAFAPALTVEELDSRIAKILEERFEKNNTREVKKFLHSTIGPDDALRYRYRGEGRSARRLCQ